MTKHTKPIDKLLDCQHVKRWTLVCTTADSTVASHSFNVACIAMAIRQAMYNTNHFSEQDVCYHALLHDVDESETGDIPTPTKRAIRYAGVEPNHLFETQGLLPDPVAEIKAIIRVADLIDNWFFIHEHGSGGRARSAAAEVRGRLDEAIRDARPDLQQAAVAVLSYIEQRRSDNVEERERIAQSSENLRRNLHFGRTPNTPYVGGKSPNGAGRS